MAVKTYDPKKVVVSVGGVPISGYADGTFVNISRQNDAFTSVAGADGEVSRAKSNDKRGEMTLTLLQTSLSNDVLSGIAQLDEKSNLGVVPVIVKDISGLSTYFAGSAWIKKMPDSGFGKEIENREWVFELAEMEVFVGGVAI
jgi:hypothetical protein